MDDSLLPRLRGLIPAAQVHTPTRAPAAQASAATPSKLSARAPAKLVGSAAAPAKRLRPPDPGAPEAAPAKRRRPLADPAQAATAAEEGPEEKLAKWKPFLPLRPGVTQSWLGLRRSADGRVHFGCVLCAQHRGENCRDALARFAVPPSQARLPNLRRHGKPRPTWQLRRWRRGKQAVPPRRRPRLSKPCGASWGAAPRLSAVDEEEIHDGVVFSGFAGRGARHAGQVRHHQHRDG